jgi:hypothetical protein
LIAQKNRRRLYGLQFYRIFYGHSVYIVINDGPISARHQDPTTPRQRLENAKLSSCRETIEWDYGDIGRYFKLLDYKHVLQIMHQFQACLVSVVEDSVLRLQEAERCLLQRCVYLLLYYVMLSQQ